MRTTSNISTAMPLGRGTRQFLGGGILFALMLIITCACTIPFLFESSTLFYKFGIDKIMLRSGKIAGIVAVVLMVFQVVLASRFKILDRVFSINRTYAFHRGCGILLLLLVSFHPIFILAAEDFALYPLERRYWPEFLGIALWAGFLCLVLVSLFRRRLGIAYERWMTLHRMGTPVLLVAVFIHVLFVSETFEHGLPRALLLSIAAITVLLLVRIWWRRHMLTQRNRFFISGIRNAGKDAFAIDIEDRGRSEFTYLPGQFVFVTPITDGLAAEAHPFTLSSSPTRPEGLQITVRRAGDWTARISKLAPGDAVILDGPYGLFSHLLISQTTPMLMIAGGIGITPMLSMLRYMADHGEKREILLIWSNRTKADAVFQKEFGELKLHLSGLRVIPVFTRDSADKPTHGRLDRAGLETLLEGWTRHSAVFICGPPAMLETMEGAVKTMGFSPSRIFTEQFQV